MFEEQPQRPQQPQSFQAQVKELPALTVGFLAMHGPYGQMKDGFPKLFHWITALGVAPDGMPSAVFLSDPKETSEEEAEWELWIPFAGDTPPSGPNEKGLGIKQIEPTTIASTTHRGPYNGMEPTYQALQRWIGENRYTVTGPPREIYLSDADEVPAEEYLTEIQIPVSK